MTIGTDKNMVMCFDGTSNEFDRQNTGMVRRERVLVRDKLEPLHYEPGVGTLPERGREQPFRGGWRMF